MGGATEQQSAFAAAQPNTASTDHAGGSSSSARADSTTEILLQIPVCAVHKVVNNEESLLAQGTLVTYGVLYPSGENRLALEVADVRWWLLPDTASLKVAPLSYMFALPDNKTFYCVTFAEDTLPEAVGAFEGVLEETTAYKKSETLLQDPAAAEGDHAIAENLVQALKFDSKRAAFVHNVSTKVANGILLASNTVASKVTEQGQKMQTGEANPGRPVPAVFKHSAGAVRTGTKGLAKLANGVVNAVVTVPAFILDKVTGGGGKQPKPGEQPKPQSATSQMMLASAVSFTMVYEAMESGAKLVFTGARDATSGVVTHKYGPDAGKLTSDTLASGGHAFNAYTAYRNIAVKAVARKTAKTTAKRMLHNYMGKAQGQSADEVKLAARNSIKQHASSMRKGSKPPPPQQTPHHIMLESHNSRQSSMRK